MTQSFLNIGQKIPFFSVKEYLDDQLPIPEDIVSPRILTKRGLLVFGGPPKIGKSDFLISWLIHMAAGVSFLGMTPSRPLKIFYMQTEIEYEYMKERLQQLQLDNGLLDIAANNLIITPRVQLSFNSEEIDEIKNTVKERFKPDIIAIDPLRNIFSSEYGNENDNSAMLFFLQKTLEKLRNAINPDAGIILTHHTKKLSKKMLEEDPFQGLSGAGSLRGFYTTGMVMFGQDEESTTRQIVFELRNGERVPNKFVDKINGYWQLVDQWNS
ncbi:MAG: helicase RepA family protein [Wolbachia endosymbiont of Pissodes strobi]|uniref:helicase RepA family protein n=1 Tax=Wolbachia endosymbiont (group A) of Epistrophe grossularia TaxID=2954008 RepID=UPI00222F2352|nr:helicase RepA family protein [Wolbachia endosymbiont (group A) of Epistrophe grossularia]MBV2146033.1 helicase RepA family protein [Wolbachia endosymbiont of Pissodes strobi]